MDETLKRLIEIENNARNKLDNCTSEYETEYDINLDILEATKVLIENYIRYKKAEEKLTECIDKQVKYYDAINNINLN